MCPFINHLKSAIDGLIMILKKPPVRKRIGRDVEDGHQQHVFSERKSMLSGEPSLRLVLTHSVLLVGTRTEGESYTERTAPTPYRALAWVDRLRPESLEELGTSRPG